MYLLLFQCASKKAAHTTISQLSCIRPLEFRVFQENSTFVASISSKERSQILVLEQCSYEETKPKRKYIFLLTKISHSVTKGQRRTFSLIALILKPSLSMNLFELIPNILKWIYVFQSCSEFNFF